MKKVSAEAPRSPVPLPEEVFVSVLRSWNGWRTSQARVADLEDVHWFQPAGAPNGLLHAYVSRSKVALAAGTDTAEDSSLTERMLVCVLKSHTPPAIYSVLADRAKRPALRPPAKTTNS